METTQANTASVISKEQFLAHWQGHRGLTRRVIEAFPEEAFFNHSVGGMRTFSALVKEMLAIGVPGLRQIVTGEAVKFDESAIQGQTKADFLTVWDKDTETINQLWAQLTNERFGETILLFGQYENSVLDNILYFIDNEIHHRGQGYVYLRSLGIEPPFFWER